MGRGSAPESRPHPGSTIYASVGRPRTFENKFTGNAEELSPAVLQGEFMLVDVVCRKVPFLWLN